MTAIIVAVKAMILFGALLAAVFAGALLLGFGPVEAGEAGCIGAMPQTCVFTIL
jgi:hypothetical protein